MSSDGDPGLVRRRTGSRRRRSGTAPAATMLKTPAVHGGDDGDLAGDLGPATRDSSAISSAPNIGTSTMAGRIGKPERAAFGGEDGRGHHEGHPGQDEGDEQHRAEADHRARSCARSRSGRWRSLAGASAGELADAVDGAVDDDPVEQRRRASKSLRPGPPMNTVTPWSMYQPWYRNGSSIFVAGERALHVDDVGRGRCR